MIESFTVNNTQNKRPLFPEIEKVGLCPSPFLGQGDAVRTTAINGLAGIGRAVTGFVEALPVLDIAFLLLVLIYATT